MEEMEIQKENRTFCVVKLRILQCWVTKLMLHYTFQSFIKHSYEKLHLAKKNVELSSRGYRPIYSL